MKVRFENNAMSTVEPSDDDLPDIVLSAFRRDAIGITRFSPIQPRELSTETAD